MGSGRSGKGERPPRSRLSDRPYADAQARRYGATPQWTSPTRVDRPPGGVILLAVLYLLNGAVIMTVAFLFVIATRGWGFVCMLPLILLGMLYAAIGFGLYALRAWAWLTAILFAILGLVIYAATLAFGRQETPLGASIAALGIVFNVLVILYLGMSHYKFE